MREQFEKLPEIAAHIHNVIFDISCDEYLPKKMGYVIHEFSAYYLNGAWYAFQEQQKKIDAANTLKNDLNGLIDGFLCCEFMATKVDCVEFINGLKELLK